MGCVVSTTTVSRTRFNYNDRKTGARFSLVTTGVTIQCLDKSGEVHITPNLAREIAEWVLGQHETQRPVT